MKILNKILIIAKYIFLILTLIFLFIDWKISVWLLFLGSIFHVVPLGPDALLRVITGQLFIVF